MSAIDEKYHLTDTCVGCRRVTWLCARDRRCKRYATTPKPGYNPGSCGYERGNTAVTNEKRRDEE